VPKRIPDEDLTTIEQACDAMQTARRRSKFNAS
jgi:hypothetical protein